MLLSIIGVILGLLILLLLLNLRYSYEGKIDKRKIKKFLENKEELGTKPRHCPVCGSRLGQKDVIYAEIFQSEPRDKVIIKGCKYCYRLSYDEATKIRPYQKKFRQDDIGIGRDI